MKYFYDTEFIDDGRTIELISIGVAAEDGREYYGISSEFNPDRAGRWVRTHVLPKLQAGGPRARRSGIVLLALAGAMTLSGYALQTVADDAWRIATAWLHGVTGTLFAVLLVGHLVSGRVGAPRR